MKAGHVLEGTVERENNLAIYFKVQSANIRTDKALSVKIDPVEKISLSDGSVVTGVLQAEGASFRLSGNEYAAGDALIPASSISSRENWTMATVGISPGNSLRGRMFSKGENSLELSTMDPASDFIILDKREIGGVEAIRGMEEPTRRRGTSLAVAYRNLIPQSPVFSIGHGVSGQLQWNSGFASVIAPSQWRLSAEGAFFRNGALGLDIFSTGIGPAWLIRPWNIRAGYFAAGFAGGAAWLRTFGTNFETSGPALSLSAHAGYEIPIRTLTLFFRGQWQRVSQEGETAAQFRTWALMAGVSYDI